MLSQVWDLTRGDITPRCSHSSALLLVIIAAALFMKLNMTMMMMSICAGTMRRISPEKAMVGLGPESPEMKREMRSLGIRPPNSYHMSSHILFERLTQNHWIDLPLEMMELILQYMTEEDIQMTRLVCKDWREALSSCILSLKPRTFEMVYPDIFSNVYELDLRECSGTLTDDGLIRGLLQFRMLHKLNLAGCAQITDASMTVVFSHPNSPLRHIRWISLHHCPKLTDTTIHAMCQGNAPDFVSEIEYLDLSGCVLLTDASTKVIGTRMPYLKDLRLGGYSRTVVVNDGMLQELSQCTTLDTLDISGCIAITGEGLAPVLMNMNRLKYLNLWNCMSLQSSSLACFSQRGYAEGLIELSLRGCHGIDDGVFVHIAQLENLEKLDLRSCELITGKTIGQLWSDNARKLRKLQSLNMKCCFGLTDLRGIGRIQSLRNLNLGECWQLTSDALQYLYTLENIVCLDISGCRNISNPLYSGIPGLSNMKRIEVLNLSNCERLGPYSLSSLASLHSIQVLDISGCAQIPPSDVKYLWGLKKLKRLNASHSTWSGCSALRFLAPVDSIEELSLSACSNLVGTSLIPLKRLTKLKRLVFDGCSSIPLFDRGLCAISSSLPFLTHLSMQNCITIGDSGLASLGQLQNLQFVNLSDCYGITGEGFQYWTRMQHLHTVILQGCSSIMDHGVYHLVSNNQSIREINLKQCRRITDKAITYIASYLPGIKVLSFQASMGITNHGVRTIAREMSNSLTHLTIQFCWQFGDESAVELARMPWLKYLDLLYSWKITDEAITALASSSSLVHLNIFGCHRVSNEAKDKIASKLSPMCRS